jgi:P4 family phage/plasmid primase-like protien
MGLAFSSGVLPCPDAKPEVRDDINACAVWVLHQKPFAPDQQGSDHNLVYLEGQFFQRYQHVWVQVSDQSVESVFQSFYIMAKKSQISNMMSFAKNYLYLPMRSMPFWKAGFPTQGYPADPRKIIPFGNGLFDVENYIVTGDAAGSLKPFTDNLFNTMKLPYDLVPGATCPKWEQFLASIWGSATSERSEFLQEWIGHLMVPDITQHKIAVLHGVPRSGKSTIGRLIQRIIGKENVAAANLMAMSSNHGLGPFVGKNAMIFFDAHMGSKNTGEQSLELLKSISGGDPVQVNPKFLAPYDITLSARIMIICNEIPRFRDAGNALLARMIPLRFDRTFFGQEDQHLEVELVKELPGIANWALAGIRRYISNGRLSMPNEASRDIIDIKRVMNPVSAFADDCMIFPTADVNDYAFVNDMHRAWIMWAEENYVSFVDTKDRFLSKLRAVTPTVVQTRRKGIPAWTGIKFREESYQKYISNPTSNNEVLF